jgi:hypothetical protein
MKHLYSALLSLAFAIPACAGVHMLSTVEFLAEKKDPMSINLWLDKDRVRMEGMGQGYMIYRGDKELFWMVNEKDKTYTEMTKKDMEEVAGKMDEAMKKLNEQMAKMPPEQREMMEKMMKGMKGGQPGAVSKTTYKKLGGETVNGWSCDNYEGDRDGEKKSEVCFAAVKKTDITEADVQVLKDMAGFFSKMAKSIETFIPTATDNSVPKGLPVRTVSFKDGKPSAKTEVKEIKKENLSADKFELPAGLTKKNMGGGPREGGGF